MLVTRMQKEFSRTMITRKGNLRETWHPQLVTAVAPAYHGFDPVLASV